MWTYLVIYESGGHRRVHFGGKYHSEMIARFLLAAFICGLKPDQQLVRSKIVFIPKEDDEPTCL